MTVEFQNLPVNANARYVDYIYLDTEERRRSRRRSTNTWSSRCRPATRALSVGTNKITLQFNHPVKELCGASRTRP